MERIKRVYQKGKVLSRAVGAILFLFIVSKSFFEDGFRLTGSAVDLLVILFLAMYFGMILWMILPGLAAFQSLEIDREELRLYIGPLLLRRIPLRCIHSVTRTRKFGGEKSKDSLDVVVLLFESPARCRELGERPRFGRSFWAEDSQQLRTALEKNLPRAKTATAGVSREGELSFHRMRLWPMGIGFFFFGLGFLILGLWAMTDGFTGWWLRFWEAEELPMAILMFCFPILWFSIPVFAMFHMRWALQTIRLDRQELRVCLGPIILRRIPCRQIRTVVRAEEREGDLENGGMLILCTEDVAALWNGRTTVQVKKRLRWGRVPGTVRTDWSAELEAALKQYLPGAEFVS